MKTGSARVLVVTPTLGESPFLGRTMDSIFGQPLEIQAMISAPAARVAPLAKRFPKARVVPDAGKAGGIYGALNAALSAAGDDWDWFTYINDDDALLPGFGAMAARHLRRPSPEPVVYGDVGLIDESGREIALVTTARAPGWIRAFLQCGISPLMQQGMLFSRETVRRIGGFDTKYRLCADLDFWVRAYTSGAPFRYYPVRVAQFRLRSGQLSGNTALTDREQAEIVGRHMPAKLPAAQLRFARLLYRLSNLPRYLARLRSRGLRTSYQLLNQGSGT